MHFFVAKLLSIAVMTYTYVYHLRNLGPMIGGIPANTRINFTSPESRVPELHDSCHSMGLSAFNISIFEDVQDER